MSKTLYYTDQDFEAYMARSERVLKIQFYVCLICSLIVLPCLLYVLLTDQSIDDFGRWLLISCSATAVVCLIGLCFCYYAVRAERHKLENLKKKQQAEKKVLLEKAEEERWRRREEFY